MASTRRSTSTRVRVSTSPMLSECIPTTTRLRTQSTVATGRRSPLG